MREFKDVVHGIEYGEEGNKKWTKCGVLMIDDDRMSIKLDYIPVDSNGWFSVFDQRKKEDVGAPPPDSDVPF